MKIVACSIYSIFTILYLLIGDYSRYWGGFYMVTQFIFICVLCGFLFHNVNSNKSERLFLCSSIVQSFTLSVYTLSCIWADPKWVLFCTPWIAGFLGTIFVAVNIYVWIKYKYELR